MKIDIITSNPTKLRDKIFKAVTEHVLETWIIRTSGSRSFLTPVAAQYYDVALLEFLIDPITNNLVVTPNHWNNQSQPSDAVYAIVIGMFTATLLTHFSSNFTKLETIK